MDITTEDNRNDYITAFVVPNGARYPDDFEKLGAGYLTAVGRFLARAAFLLSKCAQVDALRLPRAERRRIARAGDQEMSDVSVVSLRDRERALCERADSMPVDWKHRWWVRGHYRAQWCPSTKTHRLTFIAPYIKGPDDMPLKHTVYEVCR